MSEGSTLFHTAEDVWFWFIQANTAKQDGARVRANDARVVRPCEPADIMVIIDRLHRNRRLDMNHFRVLRHYGVRMMAPDPYRESEAKAAALWREAMDIMGDIFIAKGIMMSEMAHLAIMAQANDMGHTMGALSW